MSFVDLLINSMYYIENQKKMNILCVCFANTCRSPMIKTILEKKLADKNISAHVDSAGIYGSSFNPVSHNAAIALKEMGLSIDSHSSRHIRRKEILNFDYFLVVDNETKIELIKKGISPKIIFILNEKNNGIPDPIGHNLKLYRECAQIIEESLEDFITKNLFIFE